MYAALFEFAYLTALRAKDVRLLRWQDVGETEILIEPTKTLEPQTWRNPVETPPKLADS